MKKVAIIGAGNVGGTAALRIAESGLAGVVLIDVAKDLAHAKACDIEDAQYARGKRVLIEGTQDSQKMANSDIVVITAGLARKPGMSREDLLLNNSAIMRQVCEGISSLAKDAVVIVVTNPLDVMTYLAFKALGFQRQRIIGMGVSLDSSRFANLISKKLFVDIEHIRALVIGSHGATMLPLPRLSMVRDKPLTELLKKEEVAELVEKTKNRGAEIVSLYGSGSAYMAPSAAIHEIVEAIVRGESKEIPVSVCLDGEYGIKNAALGVLAQVGSSGVEKVVDFELTSKESKDLKHSAKSVQDAIRTLKL